jgi:1-deoxy-D-xylulose-5-phosphate reductoisomerase
MNVSSTRRLIVLGSTGSIGVNTLNVVEHLAAQCGLPIQVAGLAAGRNAGLLIEQAKRFDVSAVAIADASQAQAVRDALPNATVFVGDAAALELVERVQATDLMAAMVGSAGLPATLAAIERGINIGLANKETLVAAGELVIPHVRKYDVQLIPVDSEHSAIFQCLTGQADHAIRRIVLTASGGPFRNTDKRTMDRATVEEALNHPTWKMGPKISIDSATMMNKALEIIEAHWLFGLTSRQIEVIIHPQSVAHSFVEFEDNSVLAQLGPPDMQTPIQYALTYPDRPVGCSRSLDWSTLKTLVFEPPDHDRFTSLKLAYDVIDAGGTSGAVFNGANEAAVEAFLGRRIRFGRIAELVADALSALDAKPVDSLDTVLEADRAARRYVTQQLKASRKA